MAELEMFSGGHSNAPAVDEEVAQHVLPTNDATGGEAILNALHGLLTTRMNVPIDESKKRTELITNLRKVGVKDFHGTTDPLEAEDWFEDYMKSCRVAKIEGDDKLIAAAYLMKGDANVWWRDIELGMEDPDSLTWDDFVDKFQDRYTPKYYRDQKTREFLDLTQDTMTMEEYRTKFNRLSRYAKRIIPTEEDKCRRFEEGLHRFIREKIVSASFENFNKLMQAAIKAEKINNERREIKQIQLGKRSQGGQSSKVDDRSFKKSNSTIQFTNRRGGDLDYKDPRPQQSQGSVAMIGRSGDTNNSRGGNYMTVPICVICGKTHMGKCLLGKNGCYRCGQEGHVIRDCPQTKISCYQCGQTGHTVRDCTQTRSESQGGSRGGYTQRGGYRSVGVRSGANIATSGVGSTRGETQNPQTQARVFAMTRQQAQANPEVITEGM